MSSRITRYHGHPIKLADNGDGTFSLGVSEGNKVVETLTENDASEDNVLTFSDEIQAIEIYHDEDDIQEFEVNGITLYIASGGWRSPVGGTPSTEVVIPGDISCVIARLV